MRFEGRENYEGKKLEPRPTLRRDLTGALGHGEGEELNVSKSTSLDVR